MTPTVKMYLSVKRALQARWRRGRMDALLELTGLRPGHRVLDLGGTAELWELVPIPLRVVLVNLAEDGRRGQGVGRVPTKTRHEYEAIHGDATAELPVTGKFDLVHSNSVIEHCEHPENLAENVLRWSDAWWVQTPAPGFPVEAHCGVPLWWQSPQWTRDAWLRRWGERRPFLHRQMTTTVGLTEAQLGEYLPQSQIYRERVAGFTKSTVAYKPIPSAP